ncbi:hypothetical protein [Acetobacter sp. KSO5]|uniref:hypothetical protein n=1 Tax=Acetobacter sp. KSO5 TaxID=3373674 RepID=UPI00376F193A
MARYWSATRQHYTSVPGWKRGMSPFDASSFDFAGEILTPTQISEMLAGERERCATACDKLADDFLPCHPSEYAREIRNLGAAS